MTPQDMKDTGISYGNDAFPKESIVLLEGEKFYGKLPQLPKTEGFELWGWKAYADRYEAHILENSLAEEVVYLEKELFPNWVYNANPLPSLEEDEVYVFLENIQMNDDTDRKNLAFAIKRGESFDLSDYGPGDEYVMDGWWTGDSLHTSESIVVNENIYLSQSRSRKMTVNLYTGPEELMTSFDALDSEEISSLENVEDLANELEVSDDVVEEASALEETSVLEEIVELANESEVSDDVVEEASALEETSVLEEIVELDNEVINEEDMDVINQESVSETENLTN
ncbi:hypothetical protein [Ruoffia tabacinasalis]|uniref:hypothetical protein n=1 Tax=Ruoffia tabacinasalis TaxID=87458 RepID=UPI0030D2688B